MNILVTGAAGFVGNHLIDELENNGHNAIAAINNNEKLTKNVTTYLANLSIKEEVEANVDFTNIDAVIHLAGLAAVGPSFEEPRKYIDLNAGIQINLFETCLKQGVKPKFLVISSGSLYDPKSSMPLNEQSTVSPSSPYAVSKIAQEQLGHYYGQRGFEYIIARPFNHIGPGQGLGFIVPDFANQIVDAEKNFSGEVSVGNLEAKRDYTDVRDIARAYRLLIEKGVSGKTYNICSGNSYSGKELLDKMLAKSMAKIAIKTDPSRMRPSDNPNIVGDHNELTNDTGWSPVIDIDKSLSDALEDWRDR
jgi:GDP-4-dehydro-6-deoxy-D-mannose reductase